MKRTSWTVSVLLHASLLLIPVQAVVQQTVSRQEILFEFEEEEVSAPESLSKKTPVPLVEEIPIPVEEVIEEPVLEIEEPVLVQEIIEIPIAAQISERPRGKSRLPQKKIPTVMIATNEVLESSSGRSSTPSNPEEVYAALVKTPQLTQNLKISSTFEVMRIDTSMLEFLRRDLSQKKK